MLLHYMLHNHLVFILILVFVDSSPAKGKASWTLEGHGDHYVERTMQWCRGWARTTRVHFDLVFILILVVVDVDPSPSNFKMQKERPVCMYFIIEGHGDHYVKRVMQWCKGWVRTGRVTSSSTTAAHYRSLFIVLHQFAIMGKYSFLFPVVNKF
jgi:hypothetical protein